MILLLLPLIAISAQEQKAPAASDWLYSSVHSVIIPEHEPFKKRIIAPDGVKFVTAQLLDDAEEVRFNEYELRWEGAASR